MRDGYRAEVDVVPVTIGSAEFALLVEDDPDIASAAALGTRVITLAPDGTWVELWWEGADSTEPVTYTLPDPTDDPAPATAVIVSDPAAAQVTTTGDDSAGQAAGGLDQDGTTPWLAILVGLGVLAAGSAAAVRIARR